MLWITTILTLIPWTVCQSQNGYGFAHYDNSGSLSGAHDRISKLEKRYVDIEKRWKTDEIRMNHLEKQRLLDHGRIAHLEKYNYIDRQHISDLSKHLLRNQHRINNFKKQLQADNKRIADLEKERQADNKRIADLEKERQADNKRMADLEKERQADNNRIADLDQQLRVFNHVNQSESKTSGRKFDDVIDTDIEEPNAKQQQHVKCVSKNQRRRDNRQLTFHLKTNEDVIENGRRVAPENDTIAFHAFLTHSYATPNKLMELHFDRIITNTGSAYDGDTGTFTCPQAGLYVFHWTVHISGGWLSTEVVRNSIQVGTAFSGVTPTGQHTSGGGMTAVQLNEGDRVWVRLPGENHGAAILPSDTRFTGFLLK